MRRLERPGARLARPLPAPACPPLRPMSATAQVLGHRLPDALRALLDAVQNRQAETTTDRSIVRRIKHEIGRAGGPERGLSFFVHNGTVSVYGTVADLAGREAVVGLVGALPGVRRIVDHLQVGAA